MQKGERIEEPGYQMHLAQDFKTRELGIYMKFISIALFFKVSGYAIYNHLTEH